MNTQQHDTSVKVFTLILTTVALALSSACTIPASDTNAEALGADQSAAEHNATEDARITLSTRRGQSEAEDAPKDEAAPKAEDTPKDEDEVASRYLDQGPTLPAARPKAEAAPNKMEFLDHVARDCYVDRFSNDHYKVEYFQAKGDVPLDIAEDETPPLPETPPRIKESAPGFAAYVSELKRAWSESPKSHVLDCKVIVEARECESCVEPVSSRRHFRYGVYLPKAYLENPESVKSVLLLVPGGRGGRTRWFLEPIPYSVNKKRMTQGLSLQRKLDAHLESNPEVSPPIVITMDDPGQPYTNGVYEYLRSDLLNHVLSVYLPGKTREDITFGIDAISSGSRNAAVAFIRDPEAFDTFGWMCTHCHFDGFSPDRYFGWPGAEGHKALEVWAKRAQKGDMHMKMSIGKRDRYIGCNQEVYKILVDGGVFENTFAPYYKDCTDGIDPKGNLSWNDAQSCTTVKPGMTEYPGIGHSYALMPAAFDEHLYWHLDKLTEVAQARGL